MEGSKLRLSPYELELVQNAEIILTKNRIVHKAMALMQGLQARMQEETSGSEAAIFAVPPKISKGENYLGLPYVVLDYPRLATGADLCFVRTFFWWGHFFSSTLQLSGKFKGLHRIAAAQEALQQGGYYLGIAADPWQHHFGRDNYLPLTELNAEALQAGLQQQPHIKIAARWPLTDWDAAANNLWQSWKLLTGLVA